MEVSQRKGKKEQQKQKEKSKNKVPPALPKKVESTTVSKTKDSSTQKALKKTKSEFWGSLLLLIGLITFRMINACLIQTTFVPDEVWQSVEVAHRWVYGYV